MTITSTPTHRTNPRRRARRLPVIAAAFTLVASGGIAVAASTGGSGNGHSTLNLADPSVTSTSACAAADWHCIPTLATTLRMPVLGPPQASDARITDILHGKNDAEGSPKLVSYLWNDPASQLVVWVSSIPADGPLHTAHAGQKTATIHGLPALEGTAPGSGVQWVESGRRWVVSVSPDTTMDKTVAFAQSLVPYQP